MEKGLYMEELLIDAIAQRHILFILQKPSFMIRILAGMCVIMKDIPS